MKKNKKYTIDIKNIEGLKNKKEIITNSFEEAMEFVNKITDENIHIIIFDGDEKILYSKRHNLKSKENHNHEDNGHHYGHSHNHHNGHHNDDDDDLYA